MRTAGSSSRPGGGLHQVPHPGQGTLPPEETHPPGADPPRTRPPWDQTPRDQAPPRDQTPSEQNDKQVQKYYLAPNFVCGR